MQINNPSLYVFAGYAHNGAAETMKIAENFHINGAVTAVYIEDTAHAQKLIEEARAQIQKGSEGVMLNRVNIYLVSDAAYVADINSIGELSRNIFAQHFALCKITAVMMQQEARGGSSINHLKASIFDSVYLLSNHNENNTVNSANELNCWLTAGYLPALKETQPDFDEIVQARATTSGTLLFSSAGVSPAIPAPTMTKERKRVLENFADRAFAEIEKGKSVEVAISDVESIVKDSLLRKIKSDMLSIPSNPSADLSNCTLAEAENRLFGNHAREFYNLHYLEQSNEVKSCTIPNTLTIQKLAETISHFKSQTKAGTPPQKPRNLLPSLSRKRLRRFLSYFQPQNYEAASWQIKQQIAEHYARTYQQTQINLHLSHVTEEYTRLNTYLTHIQNALLAIKNLPIETPNPTHAHELQNKAAINISLLRDDGLLRTSHTLTDRHGNIIAIKAVGGFMLGDTR